MLTIKLLNARLVRLIASLIVRAVPVDLWLEQLLARLRVLIDLHRLTFRQQFLTQFRVRLGLLLKALEHLTLFVEGFLAE